MTQKTHDGRLIIGPINDDRLRPGMRRIRNGSIQEFGERIVRGGHLIQEPGSTGETGACSMTDITELAQSLKAEQCSTMVAASECAAAKTGACGMNKKSGWARPINANKHHFFLEDEATSICGRWMYFGTDREPDNFESPDDCAACRRKLNKKSGASA